MTDADSTDTLTFRQSTTNIPANINTNGYHKCSLVSTPNLTTDSTLVFTLTFTRYSDVSLEIEDSLTSPT